MSTHETLIRHEVVEPGSDRGFGLVVGGVLGAIALYQYITNSDFYLWLAPPACLLVVLALIVPRVLHPLNRAWTKLGVLMGRIVTPVVMFAVFMLTIVPIGIILRLAGKDVLRLRPQPEAKSYWIGRDPVGPPPESLKDQF